MSQTVAVVLGGSVLCIWPLLWCVIGYMIGKHGLPLSLQWHGFHHEEDEHE
jgi:hypothetical protein